MHEFEEVPCWFRRAYILLYASWNLFEFTCFHVPGSYLLALKNRYDAGKTWKMWQISPEEHRAVNFLSKKSDNDETIVQHRNSSDSLSILSQRSWENFPKGCHREMSLMIFPLDYSTANPFHSLFSFKYSVRIVHICWGTFILRLFAWIVQIDRYRKNWRRNN